MGHVRAVVFKLLLEKLNYLQRKKEFNKFLIMYREKLCLMARELESLRK